MSYVKAATKRFCFLSSSSFDLSDRTAKQYGMDQLRVAEAYKIVMLVVDDDLAVRNSLRFILEVEGFQVRVYSSAEELLNKASLRP